MKNPKNRLILCHEGDGSGIWTLYNYTDRKGAVLRPPDFGVGKGIVLSMPGSKTRRFWWWL